MIQRSFEVCGITTTNPRLVDNDDFLKRIMAGIEVDCDQTDDDDMFKDLLEKAKRFLFIFCIQYLFVFVPSY